MSEAGDEASYSQCIEKAQTIRQHARNLEGQMGRLVDKLANNPDGVESAPEPPTAQEGAMAIEMNAALHSTDIALDTIESHIVDINRMIG